MSKSVPPEVRALRQQLHKKHLRAERERAEKAAKPFNPRDLDRSKYFPHQCEREMARRVRKVNAIATKQTVKFLGSVTTTINSNGRDVWVRRWWDGETVRTEIIPAEQVYI